MADEQKQQRQLRQQDGFRQQDGIRQQYDLGSALQDIGLDFQRLDDQGNPIVKDRSTGEEFNYNVDADLNELGIKKENINVVFNTPDNPVNISPLTSEERGRLSFGNLKGSIKFLQGKFDQVLPHETNGLLVQTRGVWHTVDPTGLGAGNAWDMAKELRKDVNDLGDVALNALISAGGVAVGAVVGAVPGAIAGAGAGGAIAGKIRTSLGRFYGTYAATAEEEVQDIALESFLTMGGQGIGAGARPAIKGLVNAGKRIASTANAAVKEAFATIYGRLTGVGQGAMRTLIEKNSQVGAEMAKAIRSVGLQGTEAGAINAARQGAMDNTEQLLKEAKIALPRKWRQSLEEVLSAREISSLKVDASKIVNNIFESIEKTGLGKIEVVNERSILKELPDTVKRLRQREGLSVPVVTRSDLRQINIILKELDSFSEQGLLQANEAANALVSMNTTLNKLTNKVFGEGITDGYTAAMMTTTKSYRTSVGEEFAEAGLGSKYSQLQGSYEQFANAVAFAKKTLKKEGTEKLIDILSSDAGKNLTPIGKTEKLVELLGPRGTKLYEDIMIKNTASKFLSWAPKMGLVQQGATVGALGAVTGGVLSPKILVGLTQFSPRFVANQTRLMQYTAEQLKFFKLLGPKQIDSLLQDPATFNAITRTTIESVVREEGAIQDLLDQSGVARNEEQ